MRSTRSRASAASTSIRSRRTRPDTTPERVYLQALLLALANPYGFLPGQLAIVVRYLQDYCHWAKLTDVAPVHRMAKAVAIIPVGPRLPAVLGQQGRVDRWLQDLPAHVRSCVPDPGTAARARVRRRGSHRHPQGSERQAPVHRAAQAPAAAVGDSAGSPVQPAAIARARRDVRGPFRRLAVQPRACTLVSRRRRRASRR